MLIYLVEQSRSFLTLFTQSFSGTLLMTPERRKAIWAIYGNFSLYTLVDKYVKQVLDIFCDIEFS